MSEVLKPEENKVELKEAIEEKATDVEQRNDKQRGETKDFKTLNKQEPNAAKRYHLSDQA